MNNSKQASISDFHTIEQSQGAERPLSSGGNSEQGFVSKLGAERRLHGDFPPQRGVVGNDVRENPTESLESQELSEREEVEN